jgi:urea transport system permease protein
MRAFARHMSIFFALLFCPFLLNADVAPDLFIPLLSDDVPTREAALLELAKTGDERLDVFFEAYRVGSVYGWNDQLVMTETRPGQKLALLDPLTGAPLMDETGAPRLVVKSELKAIRIARNERKAVGNARSLLRLFSPNVESRVAGAKKCGDPPVLADAVGKLEELAASDPSRKVRRVAKESIALIQLDQASAGSHAQVEAIVALAELRCQRAVPRLNELMASTITDPEARDVVHAVAADAVSTIESRMFFLDRISSLFQGISLGSVLILMAMGLAITFGLMGVINMAHGEMMMIGAYTTYEIQRWFAAMITSGTLPASAQDYYFFAALPAAFMTAALAGYLIEWLVVRHLYRRPLESLLATWGVGLILIQAVRLRYGDNIGVNAPQWARGGIEILPDLTLPYGRLFIIVLCALSLFAVHQLTQRSRLGLRMRATMQNRDMASAMGVNTHLVDRATFALGSGLAGIAGYAWTLIGGVTPDMGQKNFIIDSFLVVVTGGVGEMLGVICAGLGIGVLTKFIEPLEIGGFTFGAIWAKVVLLIIIVTFIQFKPAGIFAPKGRLADV